MWADTRPAGAQPAGPGTRVPWPWHCPQLCRPGGLDRAGHSLGLWERFSPSCHPAVHVVRGWSSLHSTSGAKALGREMRSQRQQMSPSGTLPEQGLVKK